MARPSSPVRRGGVPLWSASMRWREAWTKLCSQPMGMSSKERVWPSRDRMTGGASVRRPWPPLIQITPLVPVISIAVVLGVVAGFDLELG